jgi:hypothetical protein
MNAKTAVARFGAVATAGEIVKVDIGFDQLNTLLRGKQ